MHRYNYNHNATNKVYCYVCIWSWLSKLIYKFAGNIWFPWCLISQLFWSYQGHCVLNSESNNSTLLPTTNTRRVLMFWQKQDNCPCHWFTCFRELESNSLCSHILVNTKWNLGVDQTRTFNIIYLEIESVFTKIYLCQCISTCVCIKIFMRQIFSFLQYIC